MNAESNHPPLITRLTTPLTSARTNAETSISASLRWSVDELGQAIGYLAQKSAPALASAETVRAARLEGAPIQSKAMDDAALARWIELLADRVGLEAEPTRATYAETGRFLENAGPALVRLAGAKASSTPEFVALLHGGRRRVALIAQDGNCTYVGRDQLQDALWVHVVDQHQHSIQQILEAAGVEPTRRVGVQRAMMEEVVGSTHSCSGWLLRTAPAADLWSQARQARLFLTSGQLIGGFAIQLLLTVAAWWMVGKSALVGHFDRGWLFGWVLLLLTMLPFQIWTQLAQSRLAVDIGVILKQRLLYGVLQLQPEEIRHQGVGQFLGRVLASGAVEQLGIAGGFVALLAGLQLGAAVWILAAGIGGWLHASLLLIWSASTALLSWLYWRRSRDWADSYREMTNDLVERMAGHRTRLAQEVRGQWHDDEDELLNQYMGLQVGVDRAESRLQGLVPRGWMVLGISGMAYTLLNTEATTAQIAVSLGGILLAYQALNTIIVGVRSIVNARIAWREVDTLFHAASRTRGQHDHGDLPPAQATSSIQREYHDRNPATLALTGTGSGFLPGFTSSSARVTPVLTARDLGFRYRAQGRPILQNCNLQVYHGDRILLEGPSGGGKSTFAALLAGLRIPESGILLLGDTDQMTAGVKAWRRHVVAVPQFHENYVFTGTFAFNLLLGRGWPPDPRDLHEADALCRELGLGELIDRMPAGLQQMVGESGWQLSHGEKSRLYIARALLQESDLLILDESFAALDPENLERTMNCVLKRASTLLVIAHP